MASRSGAPATRWPTPTTAITSWRLTTPAVASSRPLGIERQITTDKGASYSLTFDLAGRLGYGRETTRVAVYVDDVLVNTFDTVPSLW